MRNRRGGVLLKQIYYAIKCSSPIFFARMEKKEMKTIDFESLEEAFECYGRENLVPIDFIKQQIFYAKHGCQPKFIWEKEGEPGKLTCWYLKSETNFVYKKWIENRPK